MADSSLPATHGLWRRWRWRILLVFIIVAAAGGGFAVSQRGARPEPQEAADVLPEVAVASYQDLAAGATFEKVATLEPASGASLISRVGGQVTALNAQLGDTIAAGSVVVAVDGEGVASPARAQLSSASSSLAAFNVIRAEALKSADNAIATAQLSVDAARAGKRLTSVQVHKAREQADLSVREAELARQSVAESENRTDELVRSTTIALEAAELAQDQATIARDLATRQTKDALQQAEQGLQTAQQAKMQLAADLASQRVTIAGQVAAAREHVRLADVVAPLNGQITRLDIQVGDFVQPGQEVGEIIAFEGAQVLIDVPTGVRDKLSVGDTLNLRSGGLAFTGQVVRLADGPRSDVALWQVDIAVAATPAVIHPGELVIVELPIGPVADDSVFLPLDAITVRQDGAVLFTVEDDVVSEHALSVVSYTSDFVEAVVDLPAFARVVIDGNRTLQSGDRVRVTPEVEAQL